MSHIGMAVICARVRTSQSGTPLCCAILSLGLAGISPSFSCSRSESGARPIQALHRKIRSKIRDETFRLSAKSRIKERPCARRRSCFGERQHLLRVLDSVEHSALPAARLDQERRVIEQLIHARTQELNRINPNWDEKIGTVLSAEVKPDLLDFSRARRRRKTTTCCA